MTAPMRLYLEDPAYANHPIVRQGILRPLTPINGSPMGSGFSTAPASGVADKLRNSFSAASTLKLLEDDERFCHTVWADRLLFAYDDEMLAVYRGIYGVAAEKVTGMSGRAVGLLSPEMFIAGIVQNRLPIDNLVAALGPMAKQLWKSDGGGELDRIRIGKNYFNFESIPNRWAESPAGKRDWTLLQRATPGISDDKREQMGRLAMFTAARRAHEAVGLDPDAVVVSGCADRNTGWGDKEISSLGLDIQIKHSHLLFTDPSDDTTRRMPKELADGSGPENVVILLGSATPPAVNRRRLEIARDHNVAAVVLFPEGESPAIANRLLNDQLPVFRDFSELGAGNS